MIVLKLLAVWCLLSVPVGLLVGAALRRGDPDDGGDA